MTMRLNGKVAVVTGSGDGIGRAVALLMCAEGAKLVINDIGYKSDGTSTADEVVEEIFKAGGTAVANYVLLQGYIYRKRPAYAGL